MRPFLLVKAALLPLSVYGLGVWLRMPLAGGLIGLLCVVKRALFLHVGRLPPPFDTALLAGLASEPVESLRHPT
jgi:hypothetical protein